MTKNININLDAKTSHLVWGVAIQQVFQFLPFILLFSPALLLGLWMFGNLTQSLDREREFSRRVQECTTQQLRQYGRVDAHACRKTVNATYRVYANL